MTLSEYSGSAPPSPSDLRNEGDDRVSLFFSSVVLVRWGADGIDKGTVVTCEEGGTEDGMGNVRSEETEAAGDERPSNSRGSTRD